MLSDADLKDFDLKGFCGPFNLEHSAHLDRMLGEFIAEQTFHAAQDNVQRKHILGEHKETPLLMTNKHLENDEILSIAQDPAIVQRLIQLAGREIYLRHSQFWRKIGHSRGVIWHQDTHRKLGLGDIGEISAWVALEDTTLENGCVWLASGSHKGGILEPNTVIDTAFRVRFFAATDLQVPDALKQYDVVPMEVKKGQFFLFHQLCFHASGPNTTEGSRTGVAFRYLTDPTLEHVKQELTKIEVPV